MPHQQRGRIHATHRPTGKRTLMVQLHLLSCADACLCPAQSKKFSIDSHACTSLLSPNSQREEGASVLDGWVVWTGGQTPKKGNMEERGEQGFIPCSPLSPKQSNPGEGGGGGRGRAGLISATWRREGSYLEGLSCTSCPALMLASALLTATNSASMATSMPGRGVSEGNASGLKLRRPRHDAPCNTQQTQKNMCSWWQVE
jgi:hypothetical protein